MRPDRTDNDARFIHRLQDRAVRIFLFQIGKVLRQGGDPLVAQQFRLAAERAILQCQNHAQVFRLCFQNPQNEIPSKKKTKTRI